MVQAEAALLRSSGTDVRQHLTSNPAGVSAILPFAVAPWNPLAARDVEKIASDFDPDVIHIHNTWFSLSASVAEVAGEIAPTVMTLHNYRLTCANGLLLREGAPCTLCVDGSAWNGLLHLCYRGPVGSAVAAGTVALHRRRRTWARSIDVFVALTTFAAGMMGDAGLPAARITVRPNFTRDPGPRMQPAHESDRVLFVGRLSPEKGLPYLMEAWHLARLQGLTLEVVGSGDPPDAMPPNVEFVGRLTPAEVTSRMLSSRALLFPSIWFEGMPMVILEAMSAGLPVMASSIGGLPEVVGPLGADWIVPPTPVGWSQALALLEDDAAVERASTRARATFEDRFTARTALRSLLGIYEAARKQRTA